MCVTLVALCNTSTGQGKYKMVLLNIRGEQFQRATSSLDWEAGILAGREGRRMVGLMEVNDGLNGLT